MDQLENINKTAVEEMKIIDEIFGFDIRNTLEEFEYKMEGLSLTIVMEPNNENEESLDELKQHFEYKLTDYAQEVEEEHPTNYQDADQSVSDEMLKLVKRLESREMEYEQLMSEVTEKLKELQEQYSENDYKFSILRQNKHTLSDTISETSSESESEPEESSCEDYSISSLDSNSSTKRKSSSDDHIDVEINLKAKTVCSTEFPVEDPLSDMITLGPNGTQISRKDFAALQWKDAAGATRELCNAIFGERTLATHSLTGNQSPAFRGRERPIKSQLDSNKTADITHFICNKFRVSMQLVRATITTKCADAAKKIKRVRLKK